MVPRVWMMLLMMKLSVVLVRLIAVWKAPVSPPAWMTQFLTVMLLLVLAATALPTDDWE